MKIMKMNHKKEYQTNIQPNDINIVKFNAANEQNRSINKAFDFMVIILIIFIFLVLNLIYFIVKYIDLREKMDNIHQFISLLDKMNLASIDLILSIEVFKSYFFYKSIPILNNNNTKEAFLDNFLFLTNNFEESIILTSKKKSFVSGNYLKKILNILFPMQFHIKI